MIASSSRRRPNSARDGLTRLESKLLESYSQTRQGLVAGTSLSNDGEAGGWGSGVSRGDLDAVDVGGIERRRLGGSTGDGSVGTPLGKLGSPRQS